MARRTREGAARMARLVNGPTIQCGTCGQRFWTYEQKNAHYGKVADQTYCQYVTVVAKPILASSTN